MSKLFCVSPGLRVLERQMQQPPGYRPRGYVIHIVELHVVELYMVNNSSSRKRYASPKAGTELYLDLVFRQ